MFWCNSFFKGKVAYFFMVGKKIGFSTGCLYKNMNPISKRAVEMIVSTGCNIIELGAGEKSRIYELSSIDKSDLSQFEYVSLHAPDDLIYDNNEETLEILKKISENHARLNFDCVVIHPDAVADWSVFDVFDLPIAFENVDEWKDFGKSAQDIKKVFGFGDYGMICDLTHAHTIDSSTKLARDLQKEFTERICHIHLSGYHCFGGDSQKHYPLYLTKQRELLDAVILDRPIVIESVLPKCIEGDEVEYMKDSLAKELGYVKGFFSMKESKGTLREDALEYHRGKDKNGKIGTEILTSCEGQDDLTLAYSPGVAAPCLEIAEDADKIYDYTNKGNTVAVVSNGSAVLGLGNIGAGAGKPVMEGKALLFKHFADVDARDVLVNSQNPDDIVEVVRLISATYGGINLEDIKAPECFYVEEKLKEFLDIPVFHDDQHGTAIVVGAGLLNALKISGKRIGDIKVVFSGAGAAGIACAKMVVSLGVLKSNVVVCDSKGVIHSEREGLDSSKLEFAVDSEKRELKEVVDGADVFIGVSARDILSPEMLLSMNDDPVVFAMANPNPEIDYNLAKETRSDVVMATGRSDFPNQVNNVLGFPGIFRGALDVRAKCINEEMKIAAVKALAGLVDEPNKDCIIPSPFDDMVVVEVACGVALAAVNSGVAGEFDLDEYRKNLELKFLKKEVEDVVCYVKVGEKYRHFKGGEYEVVSVALDSDDLSKKVVYQALYDDKVWSRSLEEFVGFRDGVKRFEKIEEEIIEDKNGAQMNADERRLAGVNVKVKKLKENAVLPSYAHPGDAGMDLCSTEDYVVPAGKRQLVSTGIAMELPKGYWANIRGKSGLAYKKGISILGGVIEYTYRGEYGVIVLNTGDEDFVIKAGDKVAQVVIGPVASAVPEETCDLSDTVRGEGNFGSTGGSRV